MKTWVLILIVVLAFAGHFALRSWQCSEMFPNSSSLACILWK